MNQPRRGCTNKTHFATQQKAGDVARRIFAEGAGKSRAYLCPRCGKYHLTRTHADKGYPFGDTGDTS